MTSRQRTPSSGTDSATELTAWLAFVSLALASAACGASTSLREGGGGADERGRRLLADVESFRTAASPADDLTLLVVQRL